MNNKHMKNYSVIIIHEVNSKDTTSCAQDYPQSDNKYW